MAKVPTIIKSPKGKEHKKLATVPFRGSSLVITQGDLARIQQLRANVEVEQDELTKRETTLRIALRNGATVDPGPLHLKMGKDGKIEIL